MIDLQGVSITADHPVCIDGVWVFPADASTIAHLPVRALYNLVLVETPASILVRSCDPGSTPLVACTLGQLTGCPDRFWGTSEVIRCMMMQHDWPKLLTHPSHSAEVECALVIPSHLSTPIVCPWSTMKRDTWEYQIVLFIKNDWLPMYQCSLLN